MLVKDIQNRRNGLRFYGLTPPKRGQDPAKIRDIAERQVQRIAGLAPDGLIIYDLQDEAGRTGVERPFPFLPTLEPMEYARDFLAALPVPKVLYKCVANQSRAEFLRWLETFAAPPCRDAFVLVGAPSSQVGEGGAQGIGLREAYGLLGQRIEPVCYGGVAIAERHSRKNDEDERLYAKHGNGCRFFISQTVYDPGATKSLLSDYALRFAREGLEPVPFILSFSPCGSIKTMDFMKWLGISFPRWLENDLRQSPSILEKSVDLAQKVFADIRDYAAEKGIPIGVNVESVSIRKEEIEASCELFAGLSGMLKAGMILAGRAIFTAGYLAYAATLFIPVFGHMVRGQEVGITGLAVVTNSVFGPFTFPDTIMLLLTLGEAKGFAFSIITSWVLASTLFVLLSPVPYIWIKRTWTPVWILILSFANFFLFFNYLQPGWTLQPGFYLWMAASLSMLAAFFLKNHLNREKIERPTIAGRW